MQRVVVPGDGHLRIEPQGAGVEDATVVHRPGATDHSGLTPGFPADHSPVHEGAVVDEGVAGADGDRVAGQECERPVVGDDVARRFLVVSDGASGRSGDGHRRCTADGEIHPAGKMATADACAAIGPFVRAGGGDVAAVDGDRASRAVDAAADSGTAQHGARGDDPAVDRDRSPGAGSAAADSGGTVGREGPPEPPTLCDDGARADRDIASVAVDSAADAGAERPADGSDGATGNEDRAAVVVISAADPGGVVGAVRDHGSARDGDAGIRAPAAPGTSADAGTADSRAVDSALSAVGGDVPAVDGDRAAAAVEAAADAGAANAGMRDDVPAAGRVVDDEAGVVGDTDSRLSRGPGRFERVAVQVHRHRRARRADGELPVGRGHLDVGSERHAAAGSEGRDQVGGVHHGGGVRMRGRGGVVHDADAGDEQRSAGEAKDAVAAARSGSRGDRRVVGLRCGGVAEHDVPSSERTVIAVPIEGATSHML